MHQINEKLFEIKFRKFLKTYIVFKAALGDFKIIKDRYLKSSFHYNSLIIIKEFVQNF